MGKEFTGVKGQEAIEKLLTEKQGHVKAAFHRDDIGDIDLIWGSDFIGLKHIIRQREKQNVSIDSFLENLSGVIENGVLRKQNERGNFEVLFNQKVAVIAPEYHGKKITYLLTAYKTHSKK